MAKVHPELAMSVIIPLDLQRRCEQRWAARFSAARALREQHCLERQTAAATAHRTRQQQKKNPPVTAVRASANI
jgi:hypothetical protein